MKRARFTEKQIIEVLREHEAGAKTADLARKHGVSEATLYKLEVEGRRAGCIRGEAFEAARGREQQAEKAAGGSQARCICSSRASLKKR